MKELMKAIQEKAGLPADKAQGAAGALWTSPKERLPDGMGEKIESYLAGNAESIADMASGLGDQAKKMFGPKPDSSASNMESRLRPISGRHPSIGDR